MSFSPICAISRYFFAITGILVLLAAFVLPADAAGRLTGLVEWRGGTFDAQETGDDDSADYFTQQYSLLYAGREQLARGRAGHYSYSLGYAWNSLDSEIGAQEFKDSAGTPLFAGELLLAPGGLPFSLHLYYRNGEDLDLIEGGVDEFEVLDSGSNRSGRGMASGGDQFFSVNGIINELLHEKREELGVTLVAGIANGSYLGAYRQTLSNLPRILIDYKQEDVVIRNGKIYEDYLLEHLAFVSLNKKDNWFHYRVTKFDDRLATNKNQDYTDYEYQLGTIDEKLQRRWINLTNWIRISADGTWGELKREGLSSEERFNINMFAVARRRNWGLEYFGNYQRRIEDTFLDKSIDLPVFLRGEVSRDLGWKVSLSAEKRETDQYADLVEDYDLTDFYGKGRLEMFRTRPSALDIILEMEGKQGSKGQGEGVRFGLEWYGKQRLFQGGSRYFLSWSATYLQGEGTKISTDFWEQKIIARFDKDLNARAKVGFEQNLIYGRGDLDRTVTQHLEPESDVSIDWQSSGFGTLQNESVLRSSTIAYLETMVSRLRNRFEIVYDYRSTGHTPTDLLTVSDRLSYSRSALSFSMTNSYINGDVGSPERKQTVGSDAGSSFLHHWNLRYRPNRFWASTFSSDYEIQVEDGPDSEHLFLQQENLYTFYTHNGYARKLLDVIEQFEYEAFDSSSNDSEKIYLTLAGNYYLTRYYLLGARAKYKMLGADQGDVWSYGLVAAANFPQMQVSLNYSYGQRQESETTPERQEKLVQFMVRRTF